MPGMEQVKGRKGDAYGVVFGFGWTHACFGLG